MLYISIWILLPKRHLAFVSQNNDQSKEKMHIHAISIHIQYNMQCVSISNIMVVAQRALYRNVYAYFQQIHTDGSIRGVRWRARPRHHCFLRRLPLTLRCMTDRPVRSCPSSAPWKDAISPMARPTSAPRVRPSDKREKFDPISDHIVP